ncbi:MAG: hypothetical protein HYY04_11430 [Chloroflexi bacterium]|nr:hypothetical protein [Chloroflexota bacterium]
MGSSFVRGIGFVLNSKEAKHLIAKDRRNSECLLPYLTGEDVNSRPDQSPSRCVICFFDWSLEKAEEYPDLLSIVEERVKPERDRVKEKHERERWWLFARYRVDMREAIAGLDRVLVRSRVSELHMLAFVPTNMVYGDVVMVFAFDDDYHFALLQSNAHEAWVRRNASTMRTDIRYTPTDCFDNFPFPQEQSADDRNGAARAGGEYHEHRRQMMLARNLGLTKTSNLFHNPNCRDADVRRLREMHAGLDRAILACYGWQDLDPDHGFRQNERSQMRYAIAPQARREVLHRLLDLNLRIAGEESRVAGAR